MYHPEIRPRPTRRNSNPDLVREYPEIVREYPDLMRESDARIPEIGVCIRASSWP